MTHYLVSIGMLLAACGRIPMGNSPSSIKSLKYLEIFNPPSTYLDYRRPEIDKGKINNEVIKIATSDGRLQGEELELYKVIFDPRLKAFLYLFYIKHHDDLFRVYAVDSGSQEILYKFSFSAN